MGWRGGTARWALAALLVCAALLLGAPATFAIVPSGSISGTVTNEAHSPVAGIEVNVYRVSEEEFAGSATTDANGHYTVEHLSEGEYKVEFAPEFESGLNYIPQFYNDRSSYAAAEPVLVREGETTEKIDAELEAGGIVEGTVTDATTHVALSSALVVAFGPGETVRALTFTNGSGHYTIPGLATGSYKIEFFAPGYLTQYYNNQPSFASANFVAVVRENTVSGIDAAMVPAIAPVNTLAPVASGTPAVGQTLSCTTGSWKGSPVPTFTYAWLRDGVAIPGATGSTYVVQAADQGNGVTCKVTAANKVGRASAASNTLIVPVPPPPPPMPVVNLPGGKVVVVSGNAARVPVACASATCAGTIELTERVVVKRRHHRRVVKTIVLARGPYALAAGRSATIAVRLTSAGKSALAKARHHRLSAKASVSVIGGVTAVGALVLSEPTPRHGHRHR
jgi:5-hydroxyisourate hydrolase-like protein (transthyretin family)